MLTADTIPDELRDWLSDTEIALFLDTYNRVFAETQENETMAYAAALGAVNKARQRLSMRSADDGSGDLLIGGWAIKFSDPDDPDDRDSYNEYFSQATRLLLDYYQDAPLLYEHGMDLDYGAEPIGKRVKTLIYRFGVWMEHRVYAAHRLFKRTKRELEQAILSYSTGAFGHGVVLNWATGENRVWPAAECSVTKSPAEVALGPVSIKSFVAALETARDAASPVEAREALGQHAAINSIRISPMGGETTMNPELLAALAETFGVEPTPEAVVAALQEAIALIQGGTMPQEDMQSMRSALELGDGDDLAESLQRFAELVTEPEPELELEASPTRNYDALARARELAHKSGGRQMPYHTSKSNHVPGKKMPGAGVNVNFNQARKPGIVDMIAAVSTIQGTPIPMPAFAGKSAHAALKAMNITEGPTGGYLLNREMSDEILEDFYPAFFIEQLGVERVDMMGIESLTIHKYKRGGQAYFVGEGQAANESNGELSRITLALKELVSATSISNRLLAHATPRLEEKVRSDLIQAMRERAEKACLYGTGGKSATNGDSGQEPLGLLNTPGIQITTLGNGNGAKPTLKDLENAEGHLEDNDVPESDTWGWLMAPRSLRTFRNMKDAQGSYIFDREDRVLLDYSVVKSTLVRRDFTVGENSDCSHIFFGDWQYAAYGMGQDIEVIVDKSVNVKQRETYIQIGMMFDFGVFFSEAFHIHEGVR